MVKELLGDRASSKMAAMGQVTVAMCHRKFLDERTWGPTSKMMRAVTFKIGGKTERPRTIRLEPFYEGCRWLKGLAGNLWRAGSDRQICEHTVVAQFTLSLNAPKITRG